MGGSQVRLCLALIVVDLTLEFCSTLRCFAGAGHTNGGSNGFEGVKFCAFSLLFKNLFDGGVGLVYFLVTRREIGQELGRRTRVEVLMRLSCWLAILECVLDSCGFPSLLLLLLSLFFR